MRTRTAFARQGLVAVVVLGLASLAIPALADGDTGGGSSACPLPSDGFVFAFDDRLRTWDPVTEKIDAFVPAGQYTVMAVSRDPLHADSTQATQPEEQWNLELYSGSSLVSTLGPTRDLPDDLTDITSDLGRVTLNGAVDSLRAVHASSSSLIDNSIEPICVGFYPAGAQVIPASCAITDGTYAISTEHLRGWSEADSMTGLVPVTVAPGRYRVSVISWDSHSTKPGQNQKGEQWFLQLWAGDSLIATLGPTPDLPEDVDIAGFDLGLTDVPATLTAVKAVHAHYPDDEPNSIVPLCVSFSPDSPATSSVSTVASSTPASTPPGTTGGGSTGSTGSQPPATVAGTTVTTAAASGQDGEDDTEVLSEQVMSENLQQLPLTGPKEDALLLAVAALGIGSFLVYRAHKWQRRLARRAARVWRRP